MSIELIQSAVLNLLAVVITAAIGIVTKKLTVYLKNKGLIAILQAKEASVMIAVDAIEQIARNENIPNKYEQAKLLATEFLKQQGVSITNEELQAFIESAVAEMNKNIHDELNKS